MRTRRVYRAVAWYAYGFHNREEYAVTRHFHTRRGRDSWAAKRREGFPEELGSVQIAPGEYDDRPAVPPALRVICSDSDPVTFPEDQG